MEKKQDIIFIVLDTQRADRLSCYNASAPNTPHFDNLAQDATLFQHAVSPAQWTLPAHASMFTGLYPSQHTVQQLNSILPENILTIAELLSKIGYHTHVFSNNPIIGLMKNGLTRGFEYVHNFFHVGLNLWTATPGTDPDSPRTLIRTLKKIRARLAMLLGVGKEPSDVWGIQIVRNILELFVRAVGGTKFRNTRRTLDAAAKVIRRPHKDGQSAFIFINLMGAHIPYDPPSWALKSVTTPHGRQNLRSSVRHYMNYLQQNPSNWIEAEGLDPDLQKSLLTYYDAEVVAQDYLLGRFIGKLRKSGQLDASCIIITSDHGDHLGEKGRINHIFGAYEPLLHVPLLVRDSTEERLKHGQVIDRFFSTRQLFNLIMEIAGIETMDANLISGDRTSLSFIDSEVDIAFAESLPPQDFVQRLHKHSPEWTTEKSHTNTVFAVYHNERKLISQEGENQEMYAVGIDPTEEENLVNIEKEMLTQLNGLLLGADTWMTPLSTPQQQDNTDSQVLTRLRDLGYVD